MGGRSFAYHHEGWRGRGYRYGGYRYGGYGGSCWRDGVWVCGGGYYGPSYYRYSYYRGDSAAGTVDAAVLGCTAAAGTVGGAKRERDTRPSNSPALGAGEALGDQGPPQQTATHVVGFHGVSRLKSGS
jgi:hypothetical protein